MVVIIMKLSQPMPKAAGVAHTVLYPKAIAQLLVLTSALILGKALNFHIGKVKWFGH